MANCNEILGEKMIKLAKELFPINRSIMGQGIRDSYKYFLKENSEFEKLSFKSNEIVFDWKIPEEWIIRDGYLKHESGKKYAEFKKNNLHVVGYSCPINKRISKKELTNKIFTLPKYPDAVPYVTSYYEKDWGFCLSHQQFSSMPDGYYDVLIDSEFKPGELELIEAIIPGKSKKEIFFSSYLCHPSMANNELSGPVVLNEIVNYVKNINNRNFTYRFVLLPETIGSIAYLSKRVDILKKNLISGFNLTCLGDERSYSHVKSRFGNTLADQALSAALMNLEDVKEYSFLERGSDERQYCAPGIDLPLCTFCKSKFGQFPEYHTSKDNFNLVTAKGLADSFNVLKSIIDSFELGIYPTSRILCEPQLGRRNLYPNKSLLYDGKHPAQLRMDIIAYSDSNHNVFEIANLLKVNLKYVIKEILVLNNEKIIELKLLKDDM